jgi:acyl-CoA thioester hydrolase
MGADGRVLRCAHWLLDPATGAAWATSTVSAITFDLDARKAVGISAKAAERLKPETVEGLGL